MKVLLIFFEKKILFAFLHDLNHNDMQKEWEKTSCTFNRCTAEQVCDCILPFLIRAIYPSKLSTSTVSNIPITVLLIAGMSFADLNLLKLV